MSTKITYHCDRCNRQMWSSTPIKIGYDNEKDLCYYCMQDFHRWFKEKVKFIVIPSTPKKKWWQW